MIKHFFKIVWNRKRTNLLIITEIFFSFLVLTALMTVGVYNWLNYREPLGFDYHNVWSVTMYPDQSYAKYRWNQENIRQLDEIMRTIRAFPEVEQVAGVGMLPFTNNNWLMTDSLNGKEVSIEIQDADDHFAEVMKLELIEGRWFEPTDDAMGKVAVINQKLAVEAFGHENPVGKYLSSQNKIKIVGVIKDYRKLGEFTELRNHMTTRNTPTDSVSVPPRELVVRVRPGADAAFEEKLVKRLESVARAWTFKVEPLETIHSRYMRESLTPLFAFAIIAVFLLLMVALGLIGVVWQNVTSRTREIGLRRALGAHRVNIRIQIIAELLLLSTLGVLLGSVVLIQFPLLQVFDDIQPKIYLYGLTSAIAIIYLITLLCSLYPSELASRVHPTEALHYE